MKMKMISLVGVVLLAISALGANTAPSLTGAFVPSIRAAAPQSATRSEAKPSTQTSDSRLRAIAPGEQLVIVEESFDKFTDGTEESPSENFLCTFDTRSEAWISPDYTTAPGWSGSYVSMAGGCAALNTPIGGCLNTPLGDYSGELTISFRAKSITNSATLLLNIADDGIWFPNFLDMVPVIINKEDGWKEYSYTFTNHSGNPEQFIQFNVVYSSLLIDDIKVTTKMTDFLVAPQCLSATDFKEDGFTANWSKINMADHYLFSLYHEQYDGNNIEFSCDFSNVALSGDGLTGVPDEIILEGINDLTPDKGIDGSNALKINSDAVMTVELGDRKFITSSIWFRLLQGAPSSSYIQVDGLKGNYWASLGALALSGIPSDSEGAFLDLGYIIPSFAHSYSAIRYTFMGLEDENVSLAVDNVEFTSSPITERVYDISEETTNLTSKTISGLNPETDYYYEVSSVNGSMKSTSTPILAFGLSTPVVLPATEINGKTEYVANWQKTPKATHYDVRNYDVFTAPSDGNYVILEDDFSKVETDADINDPESFDNPYDDIALDEYTNNIDWIGCGNAIINGAMGCDWSQGYSSLITPEIKLDNNEGKFYATVTVIGWAGDMFTIMASNAVCESPSFLIENDGTPQTHTFEFTGGSSNERLTLISGYGYQWFLDDIKVSQYLQTGDRVISLSKVEKIDDPTTTRCLMQNLHTSDNLSHAYDIVAYYKRYNDQCASDRSDMHFVDAVSGVSEIETKTLISVIDGCLNVSAEIPVNITVYDISGFKVTATSSPVLTFYAQLNAGVYIMDINGHSSKLLVK